MRRVASRLASALVFAAAVAAGSGFAPNAQAARHPPPPPPIVSPPYSPPVMVPTPTLPFAPLFSPCGATETAPETGPVKGPPAPGAPTLAELRAQAAELSRIAEQRYQELRVIEQRLGGANLVLEWSQGKYDRRREVRERAETERRTSVAIQQEVERLRERCERAARDPEVGIEAIRAMDRQIRDLERQARDARQSSDYLSDRAASAAGDLREATEYVERTAIRASNARSDYESASARAALAQDAVRAAERAGESPPAGTPAVQP